MNNVTEHPTLIEKEKIGNLSFPSSDVLTGDKAKINRLVDLKRANELGDVAQYKVIIFFEDNLGMKKVETTVWKVKKTSILLKYGIEVPISRIHKVIF